VQCHFAGEIVTRKPDDVVLEEGPCAVCHGMVPRGAPNVTCNCPKIYHPDHAVGLKECPFCKRKF
jgi:hypothetical protein